MKLLIFAHRGEAQEFIKYFASTPLSNSSLYHSEKHELLILITGEGLFNAFSELGPVLGEFSISEAINIGIAGSLDQSCAEIGKIYRARTIYGHSDGPHFHSFTTEGPHSKIDLITSSKRVLSNQTATELSHFATLIDREAWALAKTCSDRGVPFSAIKLVSDIAGNETDCMDIKDNAIIYSSQLLEFYLDLNADDALPENEERAIPLPMSFFQKAKYRKLTDSLLRIESFDLERFEKDFLKRDLSKMPPKSAANLFLEELEIVLNPLKKQIKERFDELSSPLVEIGAKVRFDKAFEKKKLSLQFEINDQQNILKLKKALDSINFEDFLKVWDGDDV